MVSVWFQHACGVMPLSCMRILLNSMPTFFSASVGCSLSLAHSSVLISCIYLSAMSHSQNTQSDNEQMEEGSGLGAQKPEVITFELSSDHKKLLLQTFVPAYKTAAQGEPRKKIQAEAGEAIAKAAGHTTNVVRKVCFCVLGRNTC